MTIEIDPTIKEPLIESFGQQHPWFILLILGLTFAVACRAAILNAMANDWNRKLQVYIDEIVYHSCMAEADEQKLHGAFLYPDYRDYLFRLKKWHIYHFVTDEKLVGAVEAHTDEIYKGI